MRILRLGSVAVVAMTAQSALSAPLTATAFVDAGKTVANQGQVSYYTGYNTGVYEERFNGNSTSSTAAAYYKNCAQQRASAFNFTGLSFAPNYDGNGALVQGVQHVGPAGKYPGALASIPPGSNAGTVRSGGTIANQSCYLTVPGPNDTGLFGAGQPLTLNVAAGSKTPALYFGFYWGSLDSYNGIQLLSRAGTPIVVNGLSDTNGNITGQNLMTAFGLTAGQSFYFSLRFTSADNFGSVELYSSNLAFETDNFAYSQKDVLAAPPPGSQQIGAAPAQSPGGATANPLLTAKPSVVAEPAPLAALALGFAGLAALRKRR